jgi:hypothetical protein
MGAKFGSGAMSAFRAETYRAQVKRLLHLAPTMKDLKSKDMLLRLAGEYHEMSISSAVEDDEVKSSSAGGSWLSH